MAWHIFLLILNLLGQIAYFILGVFTAFYILTRLGMRNADSQAKQIVDHAARQAESIVKEAELLAKSEILTRREALERELDEAKEKIREGERRLEKRGEAIDVVLEQLRKMEVDVEGERRRIKVETEKLLEDREQLQAQLALEQKRLEDIARLSASEAREIILDRVEEELTQEVGRLTIRYDQRLREAQKAKAIEILATAIQRHAAGHASETLVTVVGLPSEDMKGRLIGREGRNIRAFEKATGVDLVIDDTPSVAMLSSFDPFRREMARLVLTRLVEDGRIHPSRIEETAAAANEEIPAILRQIGFDALEEVGLPPLHETLAEHLGRLKFRTSYSQNVLRHSIEVAFLAGMMAEELGLNGLLAKRCGLLHDIGKAVDQEADGSHTTIGADLTKRCGEPIEVVHAAGGHHDDLRVDRPYTVLVAAADSISASRPGARGDTLERYLKRVHDLETIATSFPGVDQAYAIQAGREVRVMVNARQLNDEQSAKLCRDVARKIRDQSGFSGEVKVVVIRETRIVEFSRRGDKERSSSEETRPSGKTDRPARVGNLGNFGLGLDSEEP